MKYIDSEKLIAEIERRKKQDVTFRERSILIDMENAITSLQQEQPEVNLEKEIERTYYDGSVTDTSDMDHVDYENIALHFYELGQSAKYQQDREEFAKLKAKEWQEGYDEGYAKGLNARKDG